MATLRDRVDFVIGVDTHKATHTAAVVNPQGAELVTTTLPADTHGYRRLREFAQEHAPGRRVWAIEGSGSFGSGLATHLLASEEWVVEVDRPRRPARRGGGCEVGRDRCHPGSPRSSVTQAPGTATPPR